MPAPTVTEPGSGFLPATSNMPFSGAPTTTNAAADTAIPFTNEVNHFMIYNGSGAVMYFAMDASTTAVVSPTTPIFPLGAGAYFFGDWPVATLHVYTSSAVAINPAIGTAGIVVQGRV